MFPWIRRLLGRKARDAGREADATADSGGAAAPGSDSALALLAEALAKHGHGISPRTDHLFDEISGFSIACKVHEAIRGEDGRAQTVSTVSVLHPSLAPDGLFEFQHSWGPDVRASLLAGFDRWVQTDYVTLVDSTLATPAKCTVLEMEFPATADRPARKRRAVLGPVEHLQTDPPSSPQPPRPASPGRLPADREEDDADADAEHAFCPCCLLTRSFDAFKDLLEADGYYGVRMFAMRGSDGDASADCRVNGDDFDAGKHGLVSYVETWPPAGLEFRKQYVVIQDSRRREDPDVATARARAGR
jgi:hypothetical protein